MSSATRRLWLCGLLLFLPALAVGGLALGLLAREQARLVEREQAARDSRRAAVEARARLIAENIELLLGDVRSALMATLLEAPADEPRGFLSEWQATNPLVRDVFRATADGRPVWGAASDPLREWLAAGVPWGLPVAAGAAPEALSAPAPAPAPEGRRDISDNVGQYQRARQEIQEVAKLRNQFDVAAKASGEASANTARRVQAPAPGAAPASGAASAPASAPAAASAFAAAAEADFAPLVADVLGDSGRARSGWTPWRSGDGLHLFGWRELPNGTVIGLELRLDAIKARLGEVFPALVEPGEGFTLHDASGRLWHAVGEAGAPAVLDLPLDRSALPGWSVRASDIGAQASAAEGGLFGLGASLVALLVFAILAAGALLVRQARRSEVEAAQKTSFVANVSHELKTPLTTIRLYAELLAQGRVRDEAKRADYLATIGQETERLARLVGNVLDFSRLEQGKKRFDLAPLDLAAELRRLAETHAPRLAAAGLALRVEAPESFSLATDRDAFEQIVLNLLDNACKYAAAGGEVLVSLTGDAAGGPAGTRLAVADRGPGVPEAQRERIFEKFHRVDERLTAERGGAGLGLSIARQLARGLGGDLRCEAREGGGAVFVLTFPEALFSR